MIEVRGGDSTSDEYKCAQELKNIIVHSWPAVANDSKHQIWIIVGAKCHGSMTKDIDLLLLAKFGDGFPYHPDNAFSTFGQRKLPKEISVRNICATIEVKSLSPDKIRFEGSQLEVSYLNGWKNATEQSHKQGISVKNYINDEIGKKPWVSNFIWLPNVPREELPRSLHNILGSNLTWEYFLTVMFLIDNIQINRESSKSHVPVIASASSLEIIDQIANLFTGPVVPQRGLGLQRQAIKYEKIGQETQIYTERAIHEGSQIAENEQLHKAEAELLRNRKMWGLYEEEDRYEEGDGYEEEEKNFLLARSLRLLEKEEQLRLAYEEGKYTASPVNTGDGIKIRSQTKSQQQNPQRYTERATREEAQISEAELLRNRKIWGLYEEEDRYEEEDGYEEEEKNFPLARSLRLLEKKEEQLRQAYEEGKYTASPVNTGDGIKIPPQTKSQHWKDAERKFPAIKEFEEKIKTLKYSIRFNPNVSRLHNDVSFMLIMIGSYQEAYNYSENAIRLDPNNSHAWVNKGAALNGLEMFLEALKAFEQAIQINSQNGNIYRNLGYTLVRIERFQIALSALDRAIQFYPDDCPCFVNKGVALEGLKRYQEALDAYKRAEEIDASNTAAKSHREKLERQLKSNIGGT